MTDLNCWINVVAVDQNIPEYAVDLAAFASDCVEGDHSFVEAEAAFETALISRLNSSHAQ